MSPCGTPQLGSFFTPKTNTDQRAGARLEARFQTRLDKTQVGVGGIEGVGGSLTAQQKKLQFDSLYVYPASNIQSGLTRKSANLQSDHFNTLLVKHGK